MTARAPEELLAALGAEDPATSDVAAAELAAWLRQAEPEAAAQVALTALSTLRSRRRFQAMLSVAEGALRAGIENPVLLKLYGQALIDQGLAAAALGVLYPAREHAGNEAAEIDGLIGRAHKQHYIEAPAGAQAEHHLRRAIDAYLKHYVADPSANLWHGINAVAMLARAERDGRPAGDQDFRALAGKLLDTVAGKPKEAMTTWDLAVAAEASVALQDYEAAGPWLAAYTGREDIDGFYLAGTLRQLREVWELDDATDVSKRALVDLLEARLLQAEGGALDVDATARANQMDRDDDYLEAVFGEEEYVTIQWYRAGLEAAKSVVRIVRPLRGTVGTGFVLPGEALHPQWSGRSVVVTNFHVANKHGVPQGRPPQDLRVVFEDNGVEVKIQDVLWESPNATPGTNPPPSFDTAVLLLEQESLPAPSYEMTTGSPPGVDDRVYVIGYPLGKDLAFSLNDNKLVGVNSSLLHYRAPTRKGSSGSPVFDDAWGLVALHHAGGEELPRLDQPDATYPANEGLLLSAIREHIKATATG